MLNQIVGFSVRFRGVVIALACALLGYGIYALTQATFDVFPEFAPPTVTIQAEAPGLSSEQVEALVTRPIENAVNGGAGIESLRSQSIQGLGIIVVTFQSGTDIYRSRQMLAERMASVTGQLPAGAHVPMMTPLTSSTGLVLVAGLTSEKRSLMELRTLADWTIRPRLLSVGGVANVSVFGGEVEQLQVRVRPSKLLEYDLSLDDVLAAASRATAVRGAGFIENASQRIVLQSSGQSLTARELGQTVVRQHNGAIVRLADLGSVAEGSEPQIGAAAVMEKQGIVLMISAQYGSNTLAVTRGVEQALAELKPALDAQSIVMRTDLFRPANFIETSTHNVAVSLGIGGILVVVVLTLFLLNLRVAAISCSAIPLSLLAAVIVMQKFGMSLNTMTLGGLAIAIGEVVDDAVIDVENILRRLRENDRLGRPLSVARVVLDASIEVRGAVVYATFAVILVFVPILTMSGVAGRIFAPLGLAYILAILSSLAVALTVTPALCMVLLGGQRQARSEPFLVSWLQRKYVSLLGRVEANSRAVLAAVAVMIALGLAALPFLGGGFIPELREGHFVVHMSAVPGTSIEQSLALGRQVTRELQKLPSVRLVCQRVGRAELADDTWGTHYSEFEVDLKPLEGEEAEAAESQIRNALARIPGVNFAVNTFITERMEETLSGYGAPVVINIFGPDLDALDAKATEIVRVLNGVPGASEVTVQSPPGAPQLVMRLRPDALSRWGLDAVTVLDAIETAYGGATVGQIYEGNQVHDATVILDPQSRRDVSQISSLPIRNAAGTFIPLGSLAAVYETSARYVVLHEGGQRVQTITCNVAGRDVSGFMEEARRRISARVAMPRATYVQFAGSAAEQSRARRDLLVHSGIAGLGIILLLSIVMGNGRNLLLVLLNLPFALVGGVLAVFGTGGLLSLGALVGFVTLFGITLRNSIMLISHYEHLVEKEGQIWGPATALRGAAERLSPILMTALVTGLGLLPLAIGAGEAGREIEGPMAIVILGGLVTSTVLNLLILPSLALRFGRFAPAPSPAAAAQPAQAGRSE